jgi:hypothetical protein
VGVVVIGWEYERNARKDRDKKAKEEAFQREFFDEMRTEKEVRLVLVQRWAETWQPS